MTAKEYLSQAYRIDQRINSKLEQVSSLRELSTKATATFSDVPPSGTRNVHRLEDVILTIVSLEEEINHEIDRLVDLKHEIHTGAALPVLQELGADRRADELQHQVPVRAPFAGAQGGACPAKS